MSTVLKDFRGTKKIALPGYENSVVEIYDGILYGDASDMAALQKNAGDVNVIAKGIIRLIKNWNFTNEKLEPLEVTEENIKLLSVEAVAFLAEECAKFISEAKKK